jgi:hypothetical protein
LVDDILGALCFKLLARCLPKLLEIDSEMISVVDVSNRKTVIKSYSANWVLQFSVYNICFLCCIDLWYVWKSQYLGYSDHFELQKMGIWV